MIRIYCSILKFANFIFLNGNPGFLSVDLNLQAIDQFSGKWAKLSDFILYPILDLTVWKPYPSQAAHK